MRNPDLIVNGNPGQPDYLRRWWLLPKNRWLNVYLHWFGRSDDDRACHDHPWINMSIVLSGSYREHYHDGTSKVRKAGHVVFRGAHTLHRLELLTPSVRTIFITGPKVRVWGFMSNDGWIPHYSWEDYCSQKADCHSGEKA